MIHMKSHLSCKFFYHLYILGSNLFCVLQFQIIFMRVSFICMDLVDCGLVHCVEMYLAFVNC